MTKENLWNINFQENYANWNIYGSFEEHDFNLLVKKIIDAGVSSELIEKTGNREEYINNFFSYTRNLDSIFFTDFLMIDPYDKSFLAVNIALYDEQQIEEYVFEKYNVLNTIKHLKHPSIEEKNARDVLPLTFELRIDKAEKKFKLSVNINFDIFFPFVSCRWKWDEKHDANTEASPNINEIDYAKHGFDNKELAQINSERLNVFLTTLKAHIDKYEHYGWTYDEDDIFHNYRLMTTPTGINLNYPY